MSNSYKAPSKWSDRSQKDAARTAVLQAALDNFRGPVWSSLSLPGIDMLDTRAAIKMGLYNKGTHCILTERDPFVADNISTQIRSDDDLVGRSGYHLFRGELSELDLHTALQSHRKLQFVNLDLCGLINKPEAKFLFKMADDDLLTDDALVAVTTFSPWRSYNLGKEYIRHREQWLPAMCSTFDDLRFAADRHGHSDRKCYPNILRTLEVVYGCLWRYEFKLVNVILYRDTSEMSVLVLKRTRCYDPQKTYVRRLCFSKLLGCEAYSQRSPEMAQLFLNQAEELMASIRK